MGPKMKKGKGGGKISSFQKREKKGLKLKKGLYPGREGRDRGGKSRCKGKERKKRCPRNLSQKEKKAFCRPIKAKRQ